jgi:hypothetical protein
MQKLLYEQNKINNLLKQQKDLLYEKDLKIKE